MYSHLAGSWKSDCPGQELLLGPLTLQITALLVAVFFGFFGNWLARTDNRQFRDAGDDQAPERDADAFAAEPVDTDSVAVREILAGLQELTQSVASDVGAHTNRVLEINRELIAAPANADIVNAVKTLIRANETMQSQLGHAEARLQAQASEIERHVREARTDALTKLGNRRVFEEEMVRFAQAACGPAASAWLVLIDLDRFKKFNDTYGHPAGDEVLRGVARVLRDHLSTDAVVCRHGGEEFAAIFTCEDADTACSAAEELRKAIGREVFLFEGLEFRVTTSCGLVQFLADEKAEDVLKRCDEALYQAKHHGRNCGYLHDGVKLQPLTAAGCDPDSRVDFDPYDSDPFLADLDRRIAEWKRGGSGISVVTLEIDQLDRISSTLGPNAVNVISQAVLCFLKASYRQMDHVASLKPGRFAVMLPGVPLPIAGETAERARLEISRNRLKIKDRPVAVTVSAGIAEVAGGDHCAELLGRAERCLQAAKKAGGNRISLASETENSPADS